VSKHNARFKKLNDDSRVLGIGSLFRGKDRKSWAINVDLNGGSSQSMQFSNIPVLARKRVLNPTKQYKKAGLPIELTIESTQSWKVAKASDCPAYQAHRHGRDGNLLCFVTQVGSTRVFIPQLEMARVLFYHDPFLARLSLQHNALAEDFVVGKSDDGKPLIVVREGAEYPMYYFNRDDNRRFLSWVLLDHEARVSFESICVQLIKGQYQHNNYQHWNFQFTPPPLTGVELEASGWGDGTSNTFFVWEVSKLDKLPSEVEGEIDFYHPGYERQVGGKPTKGDGKKGEASEQFDLDDDELSDSDKATVGLMSDRVTVSFKNPHITNRVPSKTKSVNNIIGDGEKEVLDNDLSPNEKEEAGNLPGGAWNNLDDQTDDAHLYIGKFQSFIEMVECLVAKHGFKLVRKDVSKLPQLGDGKKHWMADTQNPRCLANIELELSNQFYTLLEIDTSDDAAKLSTMLLRSAPGWVSENEKNILQRIMKKSLGWPSDYFKDQLGEKTYTGIPHPKSKHSGALPAEVIDPWGQRIVNWIERTT
jgi:hypothetical protein